jgi:small subunit ribosomal protein S4
LVNKKCVNIASYQCLPNDIIEIQNSKKSKTLINKNKEFSVKGKNIASHLSFNQTLLKAQINSLVNRNSINLNINELLVIEYYSRKI